jgi:hypothetical protein
VVGFLRSVDSVLFSLAYSPEMFFSSLIFWLLFLGCFVSPCLCCLVIHTWTVLKIHNTQLLLQVGRSEQLCVLAVPNHMTGADFCQFTGAFIENIKEMRFVRNDGVTDRYSVLMKFDSQGLADDFYRHYNLKPFSSMEAEVCHVVFTADVQYTESGEQASIPPSGLTELPTCPVCLGKPHWCPCFFNY